MDRCRFLVVFACSLVAGCGDDSPVGGGGAGAARGGGSDTGGGGENSGGMNVGAGGEGGMGGVGAQGGGGEGGMGGDGGTGAGGGMPQLNCEPMQNGVIDDTCGVFVNAAVAAGGTGTKLAPFSSLTEAAASIASTGGSIYVCVEPLTTPQTISGASAQLQVYGGMNCATWTWTATERSEISVCAPGTANCADNITVPLRVENSAVRLERLAIFAPDALVPGESSIGLLAHFSEVDFVDSEVTAGDAASGGPGQPGAPGAGGGAGSMGNQTLFTGHAAGGVSTCGVKGGRGGGIGIGVLTDLPLEGDIGQGNAGVNGTDNSVCINGGQGVVVGVAGAPGAHAVGIGALSAGGYVGALGQAGTAGTPGGGGGGGGRRYYSNPSPDLISKGGGGGAGGCGGQPGTGGGAGGSSFGILSSSSTLTVDGASITTGNGGGGGVMGPGGLGGAAGAGGAGGGQILVGSGGMAMFLDGGCAGGSGQPGGAGGNGGAGAGGHSAAVAYVGNAPSFFTTEITLGSPGMGPADASDGLVMNALVFD